MMVADEEWQEIKDYVRTLPEPSAKLSLYATGAISAGLATLIEAIRAWWQVALKTPRSFIEAAVWTASVPFCAFLAALVFLRAEAQRTTANITKETIVTLMNWVENRYAQ